ncbi:hypothetical protein [Silvibacterium dinghuense]|uniref:Uncharacterized protein n=1 Tax=Silvibacterium dinghuense TaxID=1560006 RepID=A0A4Q1SH37_9BACT|nr:hypothetical protein [Silvibacterium dinghuense]RXS96643.1 hypothetical protein ESZ00_01460 [Silvibacterium dinghuense]GGG92480.1 hypothetical protein GCM10011586_03980 [Silvibacterium dinghuense]
MRARGVILALLALPWWQAMVLGQNTGEQIETGQGHLADGSEVSYRIRLMPLNSFPDLPRAVEKTLEQRGCLIPQTYEARQLENVIHGSFEKQGTSDWAVLCSTNGTTALLVFFASQPGVAIMLRRQPDAQWLGSESVGEYGSAWGIAVAPASQVTAAMGRGAALADHDGIADTNVERSNAVHYFHEGKWTASNSAGS